MSFRSIRSILPVMAMLLFISSTSPAAPVIYRISGDISVFIGEGSGTDTAGLEGASFVSELIVDSEAAPASTFSTVDSERATYASTAASIRFLNRPSLPELSLEFNGRVEIMNFFAPTTFTDRIHLGTILPEILGRIEGKQIGWPGDQVVVLPLDFFPGTGTPPVAAFSETEAISQSVFGFVHDVDDDGNFNTLNGDTLYVVSNGRITASLGASCDIQLLQGIHGDGDTVTATVFRLANPGTKAVSVELKNWLEGPGFEPLPLINEGADGSLVLPAGFDVNFGPLPLLTVTPAIPRGRYEWNCRMIDPVTGESRSSDTNLFDVQ